MSKKSIIIASLVVFGLGSIYLINLRDKFIGLQNDFYKANINGRLKNFHGGKGSVHIELEDSSKYVFSPDVMGKQKFNFPHVASIGDSIMKPPKSDTLILKKNGGIYKFTFTKPF